MPAIDTLASDTDLMHHGKRTLGFEHLGFKVTEDMTVQQALEAAHLTDWNVRTEPLTAMTSDGVFHLDRHQIIMRTFDGQPRPIAPTGKQYTPVQNEELAAFAATILDESDLRVAACGSVDDGRRVFLLLKSPDDVTYGGTDKVAPYLTVATGHDGTMSTIVKPLWIRLFCTNQIGGILRTKGVAHSYSVRHTSTIQGKVAQAREALGLQHNLQDELDAEIERLLSVKVTDQTFEKAVDAVAPITDDLKPAGRTRREKVRDDLWTLWNADTQKPIAGTAWAAVNTVGEYVDWFGPGAGDADKRARAQVLGSREAQKVTLVHKTLAAVGA
ncbi:MAG: DUF945 domain-containing protein [Candidatus Nanopelagicales bacterium]|jgi:phage/plasmid-like protein (TIGR03299 family)|nr:DUF945 domain-containing protein [Candidatus Nanopelagicales bacterium]